MKLLANYLPLPHMAAPVNIVATKLSRCISQYVTTVQKGIGKNTRGPKNQLLINRAVDQDSKTRQTTWATWIDYTNAWNEVILDHALCTGHVVMLELFLHSRELETLKYILVWWSIKSSIKSTLNQIPNNKAPGPDGVPAGSYKHFWPILFPLFIRMTDKFMITSRIPPTTNTVVKTE